MPELDLCQESSRSWQENIVCPNFFEKMSLEFWIWMKRHLLEMNCRYLSPLSERVIYNNEKPEKIGPASIDVM